MSEKFVKRVLSFGFLIFVLAACASRQSGVNPALVQSMQEAGATGDALAKVQESQHLNYDDIYQLVSEKVPTHMIESYLRSTEASYRFNSSQMSRLRRAGASSQLLGYLQNSEGFYHPQALRQHRQPGQPAYMNTPLSQDREPFAYNAPMIDSFYNSSYEESLYSPFSMN